VGESRDGQGTVPPRHVQLAVQSLHQGVAIAVEGPPTVLENTGALDQPCECPGRVCRSSPRRTPLASDGLSCFDRRTEERRWSRSTVVRLGLRRWPVSDRLLDGSANPRRPPAGATAGPRPTRHEGRSGVFQVQRAEGGAHTGCLPRFIGRLASENADPGALARRVHFGTSRSASSTSSSIAAVSRPVKVLCGLTW
jgi:hypothetical protein